MGAIMAQILYQNQSGLDKGSYSYRYQNDPSNYYGTLYGADKGFQQEYGRRQQVAIPALTEILSNPHYAPLVKSLTTGQIQKPAEAQQALIAAAGSDSSVNKKYVLNAIKVDPMLYRYLTLAR